MILKLANLFIGFDKCVLTDVKSVVAITRQAQAVAEKPLLPTPHEEIEGFSVTVHHLLRQIFVGQRDKRQWVSSSSKDVRAGQKVE